MGPATRLRRLLDSLAAQTVRHEVLVVDNGSLRGEVTALCGEYRFVEALTLGENRGFSAAVNLAAQRARGDVLVLVNDDCVCDPAFVAEIAAALDPGAGVLMAAGVLRQRAAPELIDTAGMELDRTLLVYDYLNGLPLAAAAEVPDPVGPSAAAAAFEAAAFRRAGGFDERLFAYWEDVDLVLRLARAGGSCRLARGALGTHEHSATLGSGSPEKNRLMGFGRGYVLRKWGVLSPGRLGPVLAREVPLIAGQAVIDRNLSGLSGRIDGWRAAAAVPAERFPEQIAAGAAEGGLLHGLGRRWRRRRLARRLATAPPPGRRREPSR